MIESLLATPKAVVLQNALMASSLRHKVVSNNIANVNTPKFKKSEVAFESFLQDAMSTSKLALAKTNEKHFSVEKFAPNVTPVVNTVTNTSMRTDGNNVDIDIEMAELAKNNIYYDAVAQQLGSYFSGLKSVISGGSR